MAIKEKTKAVRDELAKQYPKPQTGTAFAAVRGGIGLDVSTVQPREVMVRVRLTNYSERDLEEHPVIRIVPVEIKEL